MIRRLLGRALDWRFEAVVGKLDALANHAADLDARAGELHGQLAELTASLDRVHATLDQRIQPVLRTIVAEESSNRRRLHELRVAPDYEAAYSQPDPLVSITVATVGQRAALIERALPSLLAQTHANLEVIVVGDAAADSVAGAVAALRDPRVRYANLSQRLAAHADPERHWSVGSTMARNEATRRARGLWLLHFDDDDHLHPDAIASLLRVARERRAEVAYGGFEQHHPKEQSVTSIGFPPRIGAFSWAGALVHGGLRFFERELVAADLELPGDMYMLERMLRAGVRFAMLDEVVLDYFPSRLWER
jgi:hypothetical protein